MINYDIDYGKNIVNKSGCYQIDIVEDGKINIMTSLLIHSN